MHLQPHYFDELGLIYAAKEHGIDMFFVNSGTVQLQVCSASWLSMAGASGPRLKIASSVRTVLCDLQCNRFLSRVSTCMWTNQIIGPSKFVYIPRRAVDCRCRAGICPTLSLLMCC